MGRGWPILIPTILLSLAGAYLSYNLMLKHEVKVTGQKWFDLTCEAGEDKDSTRSCDAVSASRWGTFPPIPEGVQANRMDLALPVFDLLAMRPRPVALFGMMYFSALSVWYLAIGRPGPRRRYWHVLPVLLNCGGLAGALFLTYVMLFTGLEAWCPWCIVTHVLNGLVLVGTIMLWPRRSATAVAGGDSFIPTWLRPGPSAAARGRAASTDENGQPGPGEREPAADVRTRSWRAARHPTGRVVLLTLGVMAAVVVAEWYYYESIAQSQAREQIEQTYSEFEQEMITWLYDVNVLLCMYEQSEVKDIPLRDDDPIRHAGPGRLTAVMFSDFDCPSCTRFAGYLNDVIDPMFEGQLQIAFKHYVTGKESTDYLSKPDGRMPPASCLASVAAEAAHVLGGNEAFWQAHDLLFESRPELGRELHLGLADKLGFDRDLFVTTMKSQLVADRITEDVALAKSIGIPGTPSLYLSGRYVPPLPRERTMFWEEMKRRQDLVTHNASKQDPQPTAQPQ